MKTLSLLILYLICSCSCFSQDVDEYKQAEYAVSCIGDTIRCNVVIAAQGLKMRDTASVAGKVVAVIPFGEKVEIVSDHFQNPTEKVDNLYGYWKEIKYGQKTGYAFSAYLSFGIFKMKEEYYLLFTAGNSDNNYFSLKYNYYGFYKSDYDAVQIEKINPVFSSTETSTNVQADSLMQPVFMIATTHALQTGAHKSSCADINLFSTFEYGNTKGRKTAGLINGDFCLDVENFGSADSVIKKLFLVNLKSKQKQLISESYFAFRLIWDGDLDNDGKPDFIIFIGGDKAGGYELYLSSKAKKNKFVERASVFELGGC